MDRRFLSRLPADAAEPLGEYYADLARQLLAHARELDLQRRRRDELRARRRAFALCWRLVENHRAAGQPLERAVEVTASLTGLEPDVVRMAWREAERWHGAHKRVRRNLQIVRLAARGWTDRELGRRFRLHEKHVNRVIRATLDHLEPRPPANAHPLIAAVLADATATRV